MNRIKGMFIILKCAWHDFVFNYAFIVSGLFIAVPFGIREGTWPTDTMLPLFVLILITPVCYWFAIMGNFLSNWDRLFPRWAAAS